MKTRWHWPALLFACACGGSSAMQRDDLDSELRQLKSLAAEQALFHEVIAAGHASRTFVDGHAEYLHETISEHAKKLSTATAAPGLDSLLARARNFAAQLERSP